MFFCQTPQVNPDLSKDENCGSFHKVRNALDGADHHSGVVHSIRIIAGRSAFITICLNHILIGDQLILIPSRIVTVPSPPGKGLHGIATVPSRWALRASWR